VVFSTILPYACADTTVLSVYARKGIDLVLFVVDLYRYIEHLSLRQLLTFPAAFVATAVSILIYSMAFSLTL
jgi:hypothetical protein